MNIISILNQKNNLYRHYLSNFVTKSSWANIKRAPQVMRTYGTNNTIRTLSTFGACAGAYNTRFGAYNFGAYNFGTYSQAASSESAPKIRVKKIVAYASNSQNSESSDFYKNNSTAPEAMRTDGAYNNEENWSSKTNSIGASAFKKSFGLNSNTLRARTRTEGAQGAQGPFKGPLKNFYAPETRKNISKGKEKVVSITYEEIGLFPRSFSRVIDRFLKQIFSDVENLVIQEYRFYRYLFLTTIQTIIILLFVPLVVNFIAKTYLIRPITEYFWNTKQTEIFLNSYEQKRAFLELQDFEEKLYFESLLTSNNYINSPTNFVGAEGSYPNLSTLVGQEGTKEKPGFKGQENLLNLTMTEGYGTEAHKQKEILRETNFVFPSLFDKDMEKNQFMQSQSKDVFEPKSASVVPSSLGRAVGADNITTPKDYQQSNIPFLDQKGNILISPEARTNNSSVNPQVEESKLTNTFGLNSFFNLAREALNALNQPPINSAGGSYQIDKRVENNIKQNTYKEQNSVTLEVLNIQSNLLQERLQEKTVELAIRYNNHSIEAITNFFADFLSLLTLLYLLVSLEIQINITKSFLLEVFFGLDDSKKSLLILIMTDLLVGYHSSNLWELFFQFIFNHYGIPESQTGIFLLVATLPVLLDVLFKYLIFRHLNRASPATVATYHAIIE